MKGRLCVRLCPLYFKIMCASICSFACFSYFTKVVTPIASGFIHHRFVSHSLLFSSIISLLSAVCIRPPAIFLFFNLFIFLTRALKRRWCRRPASGAAKALMRRSRACDPLVRANPSVRESAHFLSFHALLGTYNSFRSQVTIESARRRIRPGAPAAFSSGESSSGLSSINVLASFWTPLSPRLPRLVF